mmetsp:Transcript_8458/g.18552  ORF Transcript_8458/g.18552 Transcript_8458/m.18552 type:complete len:601 (-) Transcript_8458:779-2581(-)
MDSFIYNAEKETQEYRQRMKMDFSYVEQGSFVFLRKGKDDLQQVHINAALFKPSFFSFVLTTNTGERSFCSVLCFLERAQDGTVDGRSLCLLSKYPLFTLHRTILLEIFSAGMQYGPGSVGDMMDSCLNRLVPPPGKKGIGIDLGTKLLSFATPPVATSFPIVDEICFEALLSCLRPENIATVVSSLLVELPVLIITEYPELLTFVTQALLSLLFPFEWHHPYIPLLPNKMLEIIQAPFPFLIGIHSTHFSNVSPNRLGSLMIVHLDRDSVVVPIDVQKPGLPHAITSALVSAIYNALPPARLRRGVRSIAKHHCSPASPPLCDHDDKHNSYLDELNRYVMNSPARRSNTVTSPTSLKHIHNTILSPFKRSPKTVMTYDNKANIPTPKLSTTFGVHEIRIAFVNAVIDLIGKFSVSQYAQEAMREYVNRQDLETQHFLTALFSTQLWATFVKELQAGAHSQKREHQLQLFCKLLDNSLELEKLMVKSIRLYLHEKPDSASPVLNAIQRGDKVTIIDRVALPTRQSWLRFREYKGWCLTNKFDDFEPLLDTSDELTSETLHVANNRLYPPVSANFANKTQDQNRYLRLFKKTNFGVQFPNF